MDACVTDPPYGLGFMGKHWDRGVPNADMWAQVYRVLKPGAHLLSFFGTRTYHRGAVAIGIELDPDYHKMADYRIERATAQLRLPL